MSPFNSDPSALIPPPLSIPTADLTGPEGKLRRVVSKILWRVVLRPTCIKNLNRRKQSKRRVNLFLCYLCFLLFDFLSGVSEWLETG